MHFIAALIVFSFPAIANKPNGCPSVDAIKALQVGTSQLFLEKDKYSWMDPNGHVHWEPAKWALQPFIGNFGTNVNWSLIAYDISSFSQNNAAEKIRHAFQTLSLEYGPRQMEGYGVKYWFCSYSSSEGKVGLYSPK